MIPSVPNGCTHHAITYHGGACGDFVRLLLTVGDPNVDLVRITDDNKFSIYVNTKDIWFEDFCHIDDVGAIRPIKMCNHIADFSRTFCNEIRKPGSIKQYINMIDVHSYKLNMVPSDRWSLQSSITTFHDGFYIIDKFGGLKEYQALSKYYKINETLFICINTQKSLDILNSNKLRKNKSDVPFNLSKHVNESHIISKEKRKEDKVLELEYIYDKEKLRKFLTDNYEWEDKNFDRVYDCYMKEQKTVDINTERE